MQMSLVPPASPVLTAPPRKGFVRWALRRVRTYAGGVQAPPAGNTEQALYGFAQPILGLRVLLSDPALLREALYPAGLLAAACALYASLGTDAPGWANWFKCFYKAFAALAPLPSFFFANHYARLAAMIRWRMGFGACGPRELPGESLKESIQRDRNAPEPWFVRIVKRTAARLPRILGGPLRLFARLCDKLAMDSRGEIERMESNRAVSVGFSLSTAALLATPVLNLLLRPIIIAGSWTLFAVRTPSATCVIPARMSRRLWPRPSPSPTARFRESSPVQVSTRSPIPASPLSVSGLAPFFTASRTSSARPRVMMAARVLLPKPMPSEMPAAMAQTFFNDPPSSTPATSIEV